MRIVKETPRGEPVKTQAVRLRMMGVGLAGEDEKVVFGFECDCTGAEYVFSLPAADAMKIAADLPGDLARARQIRETA